MKVLRWVAPLALVLFSGQALAQGAPKQLYNKSITLSFIRAQMMKSTTGVTRGSSPFQESHIYVSSSGRIFHRAAVHVAANARRSSDSGPGDDVKSATFSGSQLVVVMQLQSGAALLAASFDPGFSSCTLSVTFGKEGGKNMRFAGLDGNQYEITSIKAERPSCSIKDGNIFGN